MKTFLNMMNSKNMILCLAALLALAGCKNGNNIEPDSFEYGKPADLTKVVQAYELFQKSNTERQDSIVFSFIINDVSNDEIFLFEDTSFVLRLPEYRGSKNAFLSVAEDFYNNCALAWSIWSNFEVWYRGHTAEELRSDDDIMQSIRALDENIIRDEELCENAGNYKDSILLFLSMGIDEWDDAHNPWKTLQAYSNAINKKSCYYYDDIEVFQHSYDSIVSVAERMGKDKFQHYLNAGEEEQLHVILTELNNCKSFDEQCALWMNWGNCDKSLMEDPWLVEVGKNLLESGKYSPILQRVWISWRALCQLCFLGYSKDSNIPDNYYNAYRKTCYQTCLKRIEKHPGDIFAMNAAASIAGTPNIKRFGINDLGNEAIVDLYNMMPKHVSTNANEEGKADEE